LWISRNKSAEENELISNYPVNMAALGWYWAEAASTGPVLAQFWHITACLKGRGLFYSMRSS